MKKRNTGLILLIHNLEGPKDDAYNVRRGDRRKKKGGLGSPESSSKTVKERTSSQQSAGEEGTKEPELCPTKKTITINQETKNFLWRGGKWRTIETVP